MAELKNMIERLKGEITGPGVMSDREMGVLNNAMSPNMNDNEPRFDSKSLQEKMFTIEANIENLTKEYDMNVRNKQYEQAQQIADMIDKLQMQKIQMQAAPITDMMMRPGEQMPPQDMMQRGAISGREMEMFKKASSPMARGGIMAFADGSAPFDISVRNRENEKFAFEVLRGMQENINLPNELTAEQKQMFEHGLIMGGEGGIFMDAIKTMKSQGMNYEPSSNMTNIYAAQTNLTRSKPDYKNAGGIMAFADGGSAEAMMSQEMSPEEGMSEIEMAKEEIMQELFIPLAENGYEEQVQIIMQFPADSPESMQAQQVLAQALSEDPEFDMEDFQMAVSIVAPQ